MTVNDAMPPCTHEVNFENLLKTVAVYLDILARSAVKSQDSTLGQFLSQISDELIFESADMDHPETLQSLLADMDAMFRGYIERHRDAF